MRSNGPDTLSYRYLICSWRKGFRNGNWRKLRRIEKALYMASLSLAKMRGRLLNPKLMAQLVLILDKLKETVGEKLMKRAYLNAMKSYERYIAIGLFEWAPQVRSWFNDASYILLLGLYSADPISY